MPLPTFAVFADLYGFRMGLQFSSNELHLGFIARYRHTQHGGT